MIKMQVSSQTVPEAGPAATFVPLHDAGGSDWPSCQWSPPGCLAWGPCKRIHQPLLPEYLGGQRLDGGYSLRWWCGAAAV